MGLSKGCLLCFLLIPESNNTLESLWQSLLLTEVTPKRLGNVEAIQKFKASRNLNETELIHNVYEHAQEQLPPTIDEEEFQECQEFNTGQDLEPPTDDLLDFITSVYSTRHLSSAEDKNFPFCPQLRT